MESGELKTSKSIHWHPYHSLAAADGFLFHYLIKDIENSPMPSSKTSLIVEDGHAVFHYLHEVLGNFKQICHKMLDMVLKDTDVVCSTDMYYPESVKAVDTPKSLCWKEKWQNVLQIGKHSWQIMRINFSWQDSFCMCGAMMKLLISTIIKGLSSSQKDMHTGIEGRIWDLIVSVPDHCLSSYFWIRWPATTHHSSRANVAVLKSGKD